MQGMDQYINLDFGTKPGATKLEIIEVSIDPALILSDFATAYYKELMRRNSIKAEACKITVDELSSYFTGLIKMRVLSVSEAGLKDWRVAKALFIPSWIEFSISRIGEVIDNVRGLKFIPVMDDTTYDLKEMLETSSKLQTFTVDGVVLHKDALPRSNEGDIETMSMAIVDGYVKGQDKYSHPVSSYVAAFLGFTLKKELDFKMLYRVTYDDVDFIREMLVAEETLR